MGVSPREAVILDLLRKHGAISRSDLRELTGYRPNTIGDLVAALTRRGIIRTVQATTNGPGRPRVPLEIDPNARCVIGLSLQTGAASLAVLNLHGQSIAPPHHREVEKGRDVIDTAAALLQGAAHHDPLCIGVAVAGCADASTHTLLLSANTPTRQGISLEPIYKAASEAPLILENDMHALAARWILGHPSPAHEDAILIQIRDGAMGSAVLVNGRPNRGCVVGANEIGHTRFFVPTPECFCGQTGCLERIVSSQFLHMHGVPKSTSLLDAIARFDGQPGPIHDMLNYLGAGLSNTINLIRPTRVVIASELSQHTIFCNHLEREIRRGVLSVLADRIRIEHWSTPTTSPSETAGYLALASIFHPIWSGRAAGPTVPSMSAYRNPPAQADRSETATIG